MAAVLLFWNINMMAALTSCENALKRLHPSYPVHAFNPESCPHCSFKNPNPGFQGREIPYFKKPIGDPLLRACLCLRTCGKTAVTSLVRNLVTFYRDNLLYLTVSFIDLFFFFSLLHFLSCRRIN